MTLANEDAVKVLDKISNAQVDNVNHTQHYASKKKERTMSNNQVESRKGTLAAIKAEIVSFSRGR